jgi:putative ABC transport system permease protein
VAERTREIGIRVALGARVGVIVWMVLRQGLHLGAIGVAAGITGAIVMGRVMAAFQPEAAGNQDPTILILCSLLLIATCLLACWVPAHRAARVNPIVALRSE